MEISLSENVEELSMRIILTIADIRDQMNSALDLALEKNFISSFNYLEEGKSQLDEAVYMTAQIFNINKSGEEISLDLLKTVSEMLRAINHDFKSMEQLLPLLQTKFLSSIK